MLEVGLAMLHLAKSNMSPEVKPLSASDVNRLDVPSQAMTSNCHISPVDVSEHTRCCSMRSLDMQDERAQQGQFGFAVDNAMGGTHQANG